MSLHYIFPGSFHRISLQITSARIIGIDPEYLEEICRSVQLFDEYKNGQNVLYSPVYLCPVAQN